MAAPKRSKIQREQDLERISSLYCQGKYMREIAAVIGVTIPQIAYDLRTIQKRWRESSIVNLNEAKQRELARIDNVERSAWESFEMSKGKLVEMRVKKKPGRMSVNDKGEVVPGIEMKESSAITREQYGDPRFLIVINKCIEQRCKILGLDAPIKIDASVTERPPERMTLEEIESKISEIIGKNGINSPTTGKAGALN